MCFFIWLMGVGLHLTMQKAKADDAVVATGAHIIKETINGNIDHSQVLSSELKMLVHKMAIDMTFTLEKHLPAILEGIAAEIRVNGIDKAYKESLTKQGGDMDSIFEALYITTQLMYSVAPMEVWVILLGGGFSWLWLDYSDKRERKRIEKLQRK